ncbi:hypothetical protein ACH42_14805 [Endozoicomonas sp. (ex Bugula neritina AB1)]|nr:hypothetical protein ACH42_14805 [Endozoicomonas sp. (ex Bugula neritina AB1)]
MDIYFSGTQPSSSGYTAVEDSALKNPAAPQPLTSSGKRVYAAIAPKGAPVKTLPAEPGNPPPKNKKLVKRVNSQKFREKIINYKKNMLEIIEVFSQVARDNSTWKIPTIAVKQRSEFKLVKPVDNQSSIQLKKKERGHLSATNHHIAEKGYKEHLNSIIPDFLIKIRTMVNDEIMSQYAQAVKESISTQSEGVKKLFKKNILSLLHQEPALHNAPFLHQEPVLNNDPFLHQEPVLNNDPFLHQEPVLNNVSLLSSATIYKSSGKEAVLLELVKGL